MVSFTLEQWNAWIHAFVWPFFRVLGLASTAPFLGESTIPARVKVGLAASIALVLAPALAPMPEVPVASWHGLWISAQQVLIGLAVGLVMRLVFATIQVAGELIGLSMGLSFATFFDPSGGANTAVLSRLMHLLAMLLFLSLNGHLLMLHGLMHTFDVLPIGKAALHLDGWGVLLAFSGQLLSSGLLLALPLMVTLLAINLALGILNRTAQQLSVFAVGFPISLSTGLILLMVVLPQISPFLQHLFQQGYEAIERMTWGFTQ